MGHKQGQNGLRSMEARGSTGLRDGSGNFGGRVRAESLLQVEDKIGQRESRGHAGPDDDLSKLVVNVEDALDHTHLKEDDGASIAAASSTGDGVALCAAG